METAAQQVGAKFKEGERYVRILETGWVYPVHAEQEKLVRKDKAEYVVYTDGAFKKIRDVEEAPKRVVSTPARRPVPAQPTVEAPLPTMVDAPEAPAKPLIDLSV